MAQFLRPDSNVTQAGFTGGFAEIDEAAASDADRAYGTADKTASVLEVGLGNPSGTPGSGTTTVRYRIAKVTSANVLDGAGDTVTVTAALYQGGALIATDAARTATATFTTYSWTPDVSSVTDWTDLRLRFTTAESGGGGGANRRSAAISWAEVETPDALAAITGTMAASESGADAFAATGTVADPSVTGTLAATETGGDAFAGTGAVSVAGTLAATEAGADTAAMAGNVPIAGTLSAAESGSDAFGGSGSIAVTGALTGAETGADALAASGVVGSTGATGAMAASESGADSFAGSGAVVVSGTFAGLEAANDNFSGAGFVSSASGITGTLAAAETGQDYLDGWNLWRWLRPAPRSWDAVNEQPGEWAIIPPASGTWG